MNLKVEFRKRILSLSVLAFSCTQIMLFTLFPLLAEKLSLPLNQIIGAFAVGTILFIWGSPYWASKSDSCGRYPVLAIGLFGLVLSFLLILFLILFATGLNSILVLSLLVLSRVIYGLLASGIVPVAQLARADMAMDNGMISSMISHSLPINLGRSLGPLLILSGGEYLNFLFTGISVVSLGLAIILIKMPNQVKSIPPKESFNRTWFSLGKMTVLPLIVTILLTSYTGILHSSLGFTLENIFNLEGNEATSLMAKVLLFGSLVMALTQVTSLCIFRKKFAPALFAGLACLSTGAWLLTVINHKGQLWVSIGLICMGIALIYPAHLALVHERSNSLYKGKIIGLLSMGNTVGYAVGGIIASIFLTSGINQLALALTLLLAVATYLNFKGASYAQ